MTSVPPSTSGERAESRAIQKNLASWVSVLSQNSAIAIAAQIYDDWEVEFKEDIALALAAFPTNEFFANLPTFDNALSKTVNQKKLIKIISERARAKEPPSDDDDDGLLVPPTKRSKVVSEKSFMEAMKLLLAHSTTEGTSTANDRDQPHHKYEIPNWVVTRIQALLFVSPCQTNRNTTSKISEGFTVRKNPVFAPEHVRQFLSLLNGLITIIGETPEADLLKHRVSGSNWNTKTEYVEAMSAYYRHFEDLCYIYSLPGLIALDKAIRTFLMQHGLKWCPFGVEVLFIVQVVGQFNKLDGLLRTNCQRCGFYKCIGGASCYLTECKIAPKPHDSNRGQTGSWSQPKNKNKDKKTRKCIGFNSLGGCSTPNCAYGHFCSYCKETTHGIHGCKTRPPIKK